MSFSLNMFSLLFTQSSISTCMHKCALYLFIWLAVYLTSLHFHIPGKAHLKFNINPSPKSTCFFAESSIFSDWEPGWLLTNLHLILKSVILVVVMIRITTAIAFIICDHWLNLLYAGFIFISPSFTKQSQKNLLFECEKQEIRGLKSLLKIV